MVLQEPDIKYSNKVNPHITEEDLIGLPAPVQRYMQYSGVLGKSWIETVRLKYSGKFRLGIDKPWMSLDATQFYTVNPPGFLWKARFKIAGVPFMTATDTYKNGQSQMLGKVAGLFTVVEGHGEEVDQGTMLRYLQEMTWFPIAYLGDNIHWRAVDDHTVDVTLFEGQKEVTGRMYFDDMGRLLTFVAERYAGANGNYELKTWSTPITEYAKMNDMMIPVAGIGVWQEPNGDFAYIQVRVSELEYNANMEDF